MTNFSPRRHGGTENKTPCLRDEKNNLRQEKGRGKIEIKATS